MIDLEGYYIKRFRFASNRGLTDTLPYTYQNLLLLRNGVGFRIKTFFFFNLNVRILKNN